MDHVTKTVERYFNSSGDELQVGKVPVSAIAAKYGTPLFIYDRHVLEQKWIGLRSALPPEFAISYSVKANPNRTILQYFLSKGSGPRNSVGRRTASSLKRRLSAGSDNFCRAR